MTEPRPLPTAKPEDFALGDVCTLGDSPTQWVVVEMIEQKDENGEKYVAARFAQADTDEGRRVLAAVRERAARNQRITNSFRVR
jgi:hypothetical protein